MEQKEKGTEEDDEPPDAVLTIPANFAHLVSQAGPRLASRRIRVEDHPLGYDIRLLVWFDKSSAHFSKDPPSDGHEPKPPPYRREP